MLHTEKSSSCNRIILRYEGKDPKKAKMVAINERAEATVFSESFADVFNSLNNIQYNFDF